MRIWRISNYADLSGTGGKYSAGRWNHLGTPIVYCADHPALAMLEILVHMDAEDLPDSYQLIAVEWPDSKTIYRPDLPDDWMENTSACRDLWEQFCKAETGALMRVPSVIMPHCSNVLINPAHKDARECEIVSVTEQPFDPRLRV